MASIDKQYLGEVLAIRSRTSTSTWH